MSGPNGAGPRSRPGRRALFSEASPGPPPPAETLRPGRHAVFSGPPAGSSGVEPPGVGPEPPGVGNEPAGGGRTAAVVHCRTCLSATRVGLPRLAAALVPSLWLPTRPWPRLMRCPACQRVSWCRIDWPQLR